MRITVVTRIYAPEPSAASFMLAAIASAFAADGHEVEVLTVRPPARLTIADRPGVRVRRARVLRDRSGYVRGYLSYLSFDLPLLFRLLAGRRADAYFVEPPPTTGAVVRVATAVLRRPYFYDAADIWSDAARMATSSSLVVRMLRAVEVFAMRGARRAFAISDGVVSRMRELGIRTPTTTIAFGADVEVFRFTPAAGAASPYFLYAGSFSEWHGAEVFVDAFAEFSRTHPGHRLVFVGNGSERESLAARATQLGLSDIEFRDPVAGVELNDLLADATASLASLKPGHGYDYAFTTKVYSSIAAGCPVVFSGTGPTGAFIDAARGEHAVGEATPYDSTAVAAAMRALADAPVPPAARRELSDWARESFSLDAIARSVVAEVVRDLEEPHP